MRCSASFIFSLYVLLRCLFEDCLRRNGANKDPDMSNACRYSQVTDPDSSRMAVSKSACWYSQVTDPDSSHVAVSSI